MFGRILKVCECKLWGVCAVANLALKSLEKWDELQLCKIAAAAMTPREKVLRLHDKVTLRNGLLFIYHHHQLLIPHYLGGG